MQKFDNFYIEGFKFNKDSKIAIFHFSFDKKVNFEEKIDFNIGKELNNFDKEILNNLLTNLSITIGISYYKLYPFANIILPVKLNNKQLNFWNKFYTNGLGEFFYTNNINPGVINFKNGIQIFSSKIGKVENKNKALLLWGGGKDSIVGYSMIKDKYDYDLFVVGKIDKIKQDTANIVGKQPLLIKRYLSENLFELNKTYYNGHVPITGLISFISLITSYLYGYNYIFTSNEKSAGEENTIWKGYKINHQYSKSLEFEEDFKQYNLNFINGIEYKSLLSNMLEIDIIKKFVKLEEFFPYFSSCNRNFKITGTSQTKRWCCNCEKCAFVYLILSAYLPKKKVINIFQEDLFENKTLLETYKGLIGKNIKPFECVGTHNESKKALKLILEKYKGEQLPFILKSIGEN